ncbi:hypothetical protein [Amycolatopsis sp. FDAARGOS 1241]|uniref:hypothetical protein n=1 Tax=Amycolatopsis sp. FDAARGOS 1241 TaxID=2778070 RepID=UPI00195017E3|nr:hypothetical protein [Amycolatopsis sp. FDAARGOS 1241]QRP49831.1 hypothetical protein I6J71_20085 [Amycolatopsis sp. FDAARGOS 1241]
MAKPVEEILANVDLYAEDQSENLLAAAAAARTTCPVPHTEEDGGYHLLAGCR